jgi:acetyl esterase/lipase
MQGVARGNEKRVLLNLHGGGFGVGWLTMSRLESIPIASVGRIKVISINYRMSPLYTFPAASEDAAAAYRELLKTYTPKNIGIYGCSAGGLLTAETVAWLQKEKLPLPAAIGIFCAGAAYWADGDSGAFTRAMVGNASWNGASNELPYFKNTNLNDPLAFPARSPQVMAKFPPTLLISATRDVALSAAAYTHSVLVDQGVDAQLHVWEGLGHHFFSNPDLPQSPKAYALIAKFFDRHLGK